MAFLFTRFFRNIVLLLALATVVQYLLRVKSYTVSPRDFRSIAAKSLTAKDPSAIIKRLSSELKRVYAAYMIPDFDQHWLPISAGGMQIMARFLLASLTEYLVIFAAPYRTTGRSGIHWMNSTCTVLAGEMSRYADSPNMVNKELFKVSDNFRHGQFESAVYELNENTYLVCYGRGLVPSSAPWVTFGSIVNVDPIAIARLYYVYGKSTLRGMSAWVQDTFLHYKKKVTQGRSEL